MAQTALLHAHHSVHSSTLVVHVDTEALDGHQMHQELEALEEIVHVLDLGGEMSRSSMVGESSPSMILKQGKQAYNLCMKLLECNYDPKYGHASWGGLSKVIKEAHRSGDGKQLYTKMLRMHFDQVKVNFQTP